MVSALVEAVLLEVGFTEGPRVIVDGNEYAALYGADKRPFRLLYDGQDNVYVQRRSGSRWCKLNQGDWRIQHGKLDTHRVRASERDTARYFFEEARVQGVISATEKEMAIRVLGSVSLAVAA